MSHPIVLSADAVLDIDLPTASAIRYDNIRVKPVDTFPYTIHFTIAEDNSVVILRVFNTNQNPIW